MSTRPRLGIFGGAFDPPHNAHVMLASAALDQLDLDELRIFPTGQAWHKVRPLSASAHRLAMARLAFHGLPRVVVDTSELDREGPTYTVDTMFELQTEHPHADLFLVLGADQAAAFTTWRAWDAIAVLATLVIAQRPGSPPVTGLPAEVRTLRLDVPAMDVSATDIRTRAAAGQDITRLVPPGVASYIGRHRLYDHLKTPT